jgi:error-prone DNA polymerase
MRDDIHSERALRLGFREISGLSEDHSRQIEKTRSQGFDSVRDLWLRTQLPPHVIERLAAADAFRSLGLDRREALWAVRALQRTGDKDDLPLLARITMPDLEQDAALPAMPIGEHVVEDYRHLHLSLKAHPLSFLRADLDRRGIIRHERLAALRSGARVTIAGLVLVRQRPGDAKAIFMTLEDETGVANAIVWLKTFEIYRPVVLGARLVSITGKLQNEYGVIHVIAERLDDLTPLLRRLSDDGLRAEIAPPREEQRPDAQWRVPAQRASSGLMILTKEDPAVVDDGAAAANVRLVMPKGRNFH